MQSGEPLIAQICSLQSTCIFPSLGCFQSCVLQGSSSVTELVGLKLFTLLSAGIFWSLEALLLEMRADNHRPAFRGHASRHRVAVRCTEAQSNA